MISQFVNDLYLPITQIRLHRFRPKDARGQPNGSDLDMLVNYIWNIALSEAFYPSLQAVEVALRNTIHTTLTNRYNTEEWWNKQWVLLPKQRSEITNIEHDYLRKHGTHITPGRVVAQLNFGFWTTILSFPYESRLWRYKQFAPLSQAFPNAQGLARHDVHQRFNNIRLLRNRIMHYEAIFDRPDLSGEHTSIHEAIQWISPQLHQGIHAVDSFPDIFTNGRQRTYTKLHKLVGGP